MLQAAFQLLRQPGHYWEAGLLAFIRAETTACCNNLLQQRGHYLEALLLSSGQQHCCNHIAAATCCNMLQQHEHYMEAFLLSSGAQQQASCETAACVSAHVLPGSGSAIAGMLVKKIKQKYNTNSRKSARWSFSLSQLVNCFASVGNRNLGHAWSNFARDELYSHSLHHPCTLNLLNFGFRTNRVHFGHDFRAKIHHFFRENVWVFS